MPINDERAEQIISVFKGLDVQAKLDALNEARNMFSGIFGAEMTNTEFARAAMRVEQLYNLIREELRVPQHRIKADTGTPSIPKTSKAKEKKVSKTNSLTMDVGEMLKQFQNFNKDATK